MRRPVAHAVDHKERAERHDLPLRAVGHGQVKDGGLPGVFVKRLIGAVDSNLAEQGHEPLQIRRFRLLVRRRQAHRGKRDLRRVKAAQRPPPDEQQRRRGAYQQREAGQRGRAPDFLFTLYSLKSYG